MYNKRWKVFTKEYVWFMVYKCSTSFVTIFRNVTYFADRISVATNMTKVFANQSLYEDEKDNITVFIEEHLG